MNVLILGADGATGRRLVELAIDAGHVVRAAKHNLDGAERKHDQLTWHEVDVLTSRGLRDALLGSDAVLNAVGIKAGPETVTSPPPLHSQGTKNIIAGMRMTGVGRLVTISASFVETLDRGPIWFQTAARAGLRAIFDDMARMEAYLDTVNDIAWTAVRPGWLLDEPATNNYGIFDNVIPETLIRTRTGDLAHFMLACAEHGLHIHETPAIARPEPEEKSGLAAVMREVAG